MYRVIAAAALAHLDMGHPEFVKCAKFVRESDEQQHSIETKLSVYGLYKQAVFGDCKNNLPVGRDSQDKLKHESWCKRAGMSREDAESRYVALIDELVPDWRNRL
jgi:acyl-CoA-binding protein